MTLRPFRIPMLAAALALATAAPALAQSEAPAAPAGPTGGSQAAAGGLVVAPGALLARTMRIGGVLEPGDAGREVAIERRLLDGSWEDVASTVVTPEGTFSATWKPDVLGPTTLRATVARDGAATAAADPLVARLTVYRPARASWYGPGFFGRRTACGQRLTRTTVGVAHRTLPCGTVVQLYRGGRSISAAVVDRGPFRRGRDWDLTQAAARQLDFTGVGRIGVLLAPGTPLRAGRGR